MIFIFTIFSITTILMVGMVFFKVREVESGKRNLALRFISINFDPVVGKIIDWSNFFSGEVLGDIFRFVAAKLGLWVAGMLLSLRNFSSKLAAHLYHTSKKVQSGDPLASHPSFFIKAILEFRDKLKEDKGDNK